MIIDNSTHREILHETIQTLTFGYCIPTYVMEESIREYELGGELLDKLINKALLDFNVNEIRRISRVLRKLVINDDIIESSTIPPEKSYHRFISDPKIYDTMLSELQIDLYNNLCELINYPYVDKETIHSIERIKKAYISNDLLDASSIDFLNNQYWITNSQDRNAFNFIEYLLILNICINSQGKSASVINKPVHSKKEKIRARKWVRKISDSLSDTKLYNSYVDTFFWIYYQVLAPKHNKHSEQLIRELLLPEEYKTRVDPYRALHTFTKKNNIQSDSVQDYLEYNSQDTDSIEFNKIFGLYLSTYELLENNVKALAHGILLGIYPSITDELPSKSLNSYTLSDFERQKIADIIDEIETTATKTPEEKPYITEETYINAYNLAYVVNQYITNAITAAKKLLETFNEFKAF